MENAALELASTVLETARSSQVMIATAESCTGGLIAAAVTDIAGSSDVFDRGFVTYSNEAKSAMLGVPVKMIAEHGAVSRQVAMAMAKGALSRSRAQLAVSVTGIAGPGGGTDRKPVGLVWFGLCRQGAKPTAFKRVFAGEDRAGVRHQAVRQALEALASELRIENATSQP